MVARLRDVEDRYVERKLEGAAQGTELRRTLSGFANSVPEGRTGLLVIGMADDGRIVGVSSSDATQMTVRCEAERCYPLLTPSNTVPLESVVSASIAIGRVPAHLRAATVGGLTEDRGGPAMALRRWPLVLVVIGVLLALVSLFADPLGVGRGPGFGWKQSLGLVVGIALAALGLGSRR